MVCLAGFMCNLVLDGIAYTFGVLLDPLVEDFGSNRGTVSLVGSLLVGAYLTSGPIVGGLVNKFGCRPVCVAGAVVSCLGLASSSLVGSVGALMFTYGIVGGFGLGLIYLPAVVAVNYYFERRRALAAGIAVCGSGVGTFLFAPLATWLLDLYGWRGANLIFAGLCLNCAVFGALMRPLELTIGDEAGNAKDPAEEEEEEANNFTVQLPDGTRQLSRQWSCQDDDAPPTMTAAPAAGINNIPTPPPSPSTTAAPSSAAALAAAASAHLPTIVENSVTRHEEEEGRPDVRDLFPEEEKKAEDGNKEEVNDHLLFVCTRSFVATLHILG